MASGYLLYLATLALLALFWRHRSGQSLDQLLARATQEHHRVHRVLAQNPQGGTWREYQIRMDDAPLIG